MGSFAIPDVTKGNAGKRATPTSAKDIGSAWIEDGGAHGVDRFLTADQRGRLVGMLQMRVAGAADSFYAALGKVALTEAMRKEENLPSITGLVLDALTSVSGKALQTAAKMVRSGSVGVAFLGDVPDADEAKKGDESAISHAIKAATDAGKAAAKSAASGGGEFDREKAVVGSFIDQLGSNAAIAFQHHREDPPNMLGDRELVMLYHSWDAAMGHNMGMYVAEINKLLSSFRASTASKIGRTERHAHTSVDDAVAGGAAGIAKKGGDSAIRDTKLVLQTYADGDTDPDLMYYMRDYDAPIIPGGTDADVNIDMFAEGDWRPSHKVEPSMVEAAVAQNRAIWGKDYEVKAMGERADGPAAYTDPKTHPAIPDRKGPKSAKSPQTSILAGARK